MKRRSFSLILVFVMVIAMATACGSKEEAVETDDAKTEETVENVEDDQQDADQLAENADSEQESPDATTGAPKTENDQLSEEDIAAVKASIRDSVTKRYLEPNGMTVEQIVWPDDWYDFEMLATECDACIALDMEIDIDRDRANTDVFMAALLGVLDWLDTQGEYNLGYFGNTMRTLQPYETVIPEVVAATE